MHPLSVKHNMPVRSKSNMMANFVALESENAWLAILDAEHVNERLALRRAAFTLCFRAASTGYTNARSASWWRQRYNQLFGA